MATKEPNITTRMTVHGYASLPKEMRMKVDKDLQEWQKQRKAGEWKHPYKVQSEEG